MRNEQEIKSIILKLYRHHYNPATSYRDPYNSRLWEELAEMFRLEDEPR